MPHPIDKFIGLLKYFTESRPPCEISINRPYDFHVIEIPYVTEGRENLYLLTKCCIDTIHAIRELERLTKTPWNYSGLKDANAITVQFASSKTTLNDETIRIGKSKCIRVKRIGKGSLVRGVTNGNLFVLLLKAKCEIREYLREVLNELECIPGIYGYQRFGTKRPVTHVIGKLILKGEYEEAVNVLLGEPTPWEGPSSRELRKRYYLEGPKVYLEAPKYMDIEREVAKDVLRGLPPEKALRRLGVFKLFLNAFQAYIYNIAITTEEETSRFTRTPGYDTWKLYKEYFELNGITKRDLRKYRVKGSRREPCYKTDVKIEEVDGKTALVFALPKGYYATSLLREIFKGDPNQFA